MQLPPGDTELIQIMDAAFTGAALRAGPWLACRPGCTQCCHGAFAINVLDALRLQAGLSVLHLENPNLAEAVETRARAWVATHGPEFPGDLQTGLLGTSEEDQERFEDFANHAACPALDPATGRCDLYAHRPLTCRVFGPPVQIDTGEEPGEQATALGCCELCFVGASEEEIAACEMLVPHELESCLLDQFTPTGTTVVAFALLQKPK
jgi:Fe-S-cluster containining protein